MKRKPLLILSAAGLLSGVVIGFLAYSLWVKEASLLVANNTPNKVVFATSYRPGKDETAVISDWNVLNPGEHKIITQKFWGVAPNFSVFAHSADPELIRWVHGLPPEHSGIRYYDEGVEDEAITFQTVKGGDFYVPNSVVESTDESTIDSSTSDVSVTDESVSDGSITDVNITDESISAERVSDESALTESVPAESISDESVPAENVAAESVNDASGLIEEAPFVEVPVDAEHLKATYQIKDDTYKGLYDPEGISSPEEEITVFSARAQLLATVLQRQMKFDKRWSNPDYDFPYRLGLAINDHNGRYMPGVVIEGVAPMTIRGDEMPIHPGDVLIKFGDGPVIFSELDINLTLFEHATSRDKGIQVPIPFEVIRDGQRFSGKTMYFFNEAYWGYSDEDKRRAFGYGVADGVALGKSAEALTLLSNAGKAVYNTLRSKNKPRAEIRPYKDEVWDKNQDKERLRQMYSGAFNAGAFLGMFCPGPGWIVRTPLARGLTSLGVSKAVASLGAAALIEVAEGVVWTAADASPLQKPEDTIEDMKTAAAYAAGGRIVFGTLTRRTRR